MKKTIVGIMGPSLGATEINLKNAYKLGKLIAENGWVLLTGGRKSGVMDAASLGAKSSNGLTIGILPEADTHNISDAVDIAIVTGMGSARNNINVLSSDVVIACGIGAGTVSEIALAIKANKPVILLNNEPESQVFLQYLSPKNVMIVTTPEEAILVSRRFANGQVGQLLNSQPTTINNQPTTINNQPTTINNQPTTINNQPTTINNQPTTINNQPSTINNQPTTINNQPTTINNQPSKHNK